MSIFGKSIQALAKERDALEIAVADKATVLTNKDVETNQLVRELLPLTTKLQSVKRGIRDRTPLADLKAQRDQLQNTLDNLPEPDPDMGDVARLLLVNQRMPLESEIQELDNYLMFNSRPLTIEGRLILIAVGCAAVFLSGLIGRWFAM